MTAIAWPAWALSIGSKLSKVPKEVWYGIAVFAAWWVFSDHYIGVGEQRIEDRLLAEQKAAEQRAREAVTEVERQAAEREAEQAKTARDAIEKIEEAEAEGENALDAIF